jgi:hypothetical protein
MVNRDEVPGLEHRETRGTLYNRVGVVKRHESDRRVLFFPSLRVLGLGLLLAHATKARL